MAAAKRHLEAIVVPEVNFRDAALGQVLDHLALQTAELADDKFSLNFVRMFPPAFATERKVTLELRRVPLSDVLRYVGESARVRFVVEPHAIKIVPDEPAPTGG